MTFELYITRRGARAEDGPFIVSASLLGKTSSEVGTALIGMLMDKPLLLLHSAIEQQRMEKSALVAGPDGQPVSAGQFGGTVFRRDDISKVRVNQVVDR